MAKIIPSFQASQASKQLQQQCWQPQEHQLSYPLSVLLELQECEQQQQWTHQYDNPNHCIKTNIGFSAKWSTLRHLVSTYDIINWTNQKPYIFTISPSSSTDSSLASGEKWQTTLLTDKQVGKATPLSIFFFTFLYMLPLCLYIINKHHSQHCITTQHSRHYF